MGIETDNFSAVVSPEHIPPLVPDLSFEVHFMSDSVKEKAQPDNLCPACGPIRPTDSSKYCPGHASETLLRYLVKRPDSTLNQGLNRLTSTPIIPHAA